MNRSVGASLIVKNESANIRECLESIKEADEIVILDTGSTDNTVEICREYTDKVFTDYKWNDDFSEARNESLSRCDADYVIIIDADEKLITPIKQIKKLVNEYWFRKHFGIFFTVHMAYEIFESPRVFKNVPEIYYINPAHNVPTWRGDADQLVQRMYRSTFVIESGYSEAHKLDPDRTLRILQKTLAKDPNDTRAMYYLGREYINRKDIKEALKYFKQYKEIKLFDSMRWDNELADVLYLLALCYADNEVWGEPRWYQAVENALWSHAVLPTSSDTCDFLKRCFSEMPGSVGNAVRMQKDSVEFWDKAAKEATDKGVLMKRQF